MCRSSWPRLLLAMGLGLAWLTPVARSETTDQRFSLRKCVPADVFVYVHGAHNPERDFLSAYYAPVWEALKNADLLASVRDLIVAEMDEEQEAEFDELWDEIESLVKGVDWGGLTSGEVVFTARWKGIIPEFLLIFRCGEPPATEDAQGLAKFLQAVDQHDTDDNFDLLETQGPEIHCWTLKVKEGKLHTQMGDERTRKEVRPSLTLLHMKDTMYVALAFDTNTLLDDCLALMEGSDEVKRLVDSDAYQQLMAKLPRPEDQIAWVDVDGIFASVQRILDQVAQGTPQAAEGIAIATKIMNTLRLIGHVASVDYTDRYQTFSESVCSLASNAKESPLYEAFFQRPLFTRYDEYLPIDTSGFSMWNGIDLAKTYQAVLDFIEEEIPGGWEMIAEWETIQTDVEFNVADDLLSWLDLQVVSVALGTSSMYAPPEFVLMLKVRDEEKAQASLATGVEMLENLCTQANQPLTITEVEVGESAEFRRISHPMLMMFRPVVGVDNGWLIIGSSAETVEKCFDCAAGQAKTIATSKRYQQEGLVPDGPFSSLNWSDMSHFGDQMAQVMGMMGFMGGIIPPQKPGAQQVRAVFGMITDLASVAQEMNFTLSTATLSTIKDDLIYSKSVTSYKPPKPEEEQEEEEE